MIHNHFLDPVYAEIAAKALGLEFFSVDQIRAVSFYEDIEEGDWFLQYRRPGLNRAGWHSFTEETRKHLPPIIRSNNLDYADMGFLPQSRKATAGFRILRVTEVRAKNEHRTWVRTESYYSKPDKWGFRSNTTRGYDRQWFDKRSWATSKYRTEREMTFKPGDSHYGIIGKFKATIEDYFSQSGMILKDDFHALFRALQTNEPFRPSVIKAISKWDDELDLDFREVLK